MAKKIINGQGGFTLVEVMIASGIFAVFVAAYMVAQGYNLSDSAKFSEDLKMKSLAETKINEIIMDPPEFGESLTLGTDIKTFEDDDGYEYKTVWKKFILPDLAKIRGETEEDSNNPAKQLEKKLFEKIKENMEKMIWQLELTIINKSSGEQYSVTTWLYDGEAELTTDSF